MRTARLWADVLCDVSCGGLSRSHIDTGSWLPGTYTTRHKMSSRPATTAAASPSPLPTDSSTVCSASGMSARSPDASTHDKNGWPLPTPATPRAPSPSRQLGPPASGVDAPGTCARHHAANAATRFTAACTSDTSSMRHESTAASPARVAASSPPPAPPAASSSSSASVAAVRMRSSSSLLPDACASASLVSTSRLAMRIVYRFFSRSSTRMHMSPMRKLTSTGCICENVEKEKKMCMMLIVRSMFFLYSSFSVRDSAPSSDSFWMRGSRFPTLRASCRMSAVALTLALMSSSYIISMYVSMLSIDATSTFSFAAASSRSFASARARRSSFFFLRASFSMRRCESAREPSSTWYRWSSYSRRSTSGRLSSCMRSHLSTTSSARSGMLECSFSCFSLMIFLKALVSFFITSPWPPSTAASTS
mmetsp:Transcript_18912/g.66803  ORF Transcript_18912/g.66803 Transcript_18912/m.66803 type:complete len:421 (-) Transcript_18912:275-1537(-)